MSRILFARRIVTVVSLVIPLSVAASESLDEIIVTADFRARSIIELAHSVTVMDAEFLEETAVQHFEELVNVVPNLNWSGDGHRARYFQIRGVGELEQYQGAPNPSIGFLIDDIDFSGIGTVATLFDMQSVEVLRGSQGSRYGANALGGLVYMQSRMPSGEREGRLELTVAGDDTRAVGAAIGGALGSEQSATFRLSAQTFESDGFRDNEFLERNDSNGRDETVVRARLRVELSDYLLANAAVIYGRIDNGYDAFALDNGYAVLSDSPGKDAQESIGASLKFEWSGLENLTLTSLTAIANSDIEFSFDADWGNDVSWSPFTYDFFSQSDRERRTISQEFRVATDTALIGLYVQNLNEDLTTLNTGTYIDPVFGFADSLNAAFDSEYESTNAALFAALDHDLTDTIHISAGLRIEHRTTDYSDSEQLSASPAETMSGGELSILRDINDSVVVFATLSRGFKAGGFNLGLVPEGKREFSKEALWTVETGIKSTLIDGALSINASLFRSRRDDQQVRTSQQLDPNDPASFVFFTENAGDGDTIGLEADIRWYLSDRWEFYANVGLLQADLGRGREQAHAPRYSIAGGVAWRHPNGLFARLDVNAKDSFFFDVSHDQKSQSYELTNARIGYDGDSWRVSLWARNLFDERYAVRGFFFGNEPPDFPATLYTRLGDPRQLGITIERRF